MPLASFLLLAGCARTGSPTGGTGNVANSASGAVAPKGTPILDANVRQFALHGEERHKVAFEIVGVQGQPFTEALRAAVKEGAAYEWAAQLQAKNTAPVREKDVLLATFYLRGVQPHADGPAETDLVFELGRAPYSKSVSYPVKAAADWVKVQVPFAAIADYAPGEASIIFRLGYEPETIEIGGITLEAFGRDIARNTLPRSAAADRKRLEAANASGDLAPVDAGAFRIAVDPGKVIRPISPYVYGINSQSSKETFPTSRRMGGNRQTAYNWEINASNAGSDWRHANDDWPCTVLRFRNCDQPAAQMINFHNDNKALGADTIVTIPLVDYVSADKNHDVSAAEKAPSKRWNRSMLVKGHKQNGHNQNGEKQNGNGNKGSVYATDKPDLEDGVVYQDELVNYLVTKLGKGAAGGVKFYSLDNEPGLWSSTHPRVHPELTTYEEMLRRSEAAVTQITRLDPSAEVLGGIMWGWKEIMTLSGGPDSAALNAKHGSYVAFLLDSMKRLEAKHRRRLMHILDFHWYPEQKGSRRVTEDDISRKTIAARLEAPRSLWDPTYQEKTVVGHEANRPLRLIPWFHELIAKHYPGTKLSITEYNYGAPRHISGGLAEVDVLGIFGREGLYLASYWGNSAGNGELPSYIAAAFKLYRNYDGKRSTYGDVAVDASVEDVTRASAYAATDSTNPKRLTIIVVNKDQQARFAGEVAIAGSRQYTKATAYTLDRSGPDIRSIGTVEIKNNTIQLPLAPLSATLLVCERD